MLEALPGPFFTDEELNRLKVNQLLLDSLSPEVVLPSQINEDKMTNFQARYMGAAIEALSIDGSQEGIDSVVDFYTNASETVFNKSRIVEKPLLLTAHDIAIRYRSSSQVSLRLLEHELNVCWGIQASEISRILLGRYLSADQILNMANKLTAEQDLQTSGSLQHQQLLSVAKTNSSTAVTIRAIDRAFARHKTVDPLPSQIFIHH